MTRFSTLDLGILVVYTLAVTAFGTWLGRRQKDARDYFLADRSIPWWAVCFSVIATETSVLTFISVPATAYGADLWMLQLAGGYVVGRITVAAVLLPGYFRGELATAYALLERRFGPGTRRFASLVFLVTRSLGSSVRLFASAIPLKLVTGLPYWQAILLTGVVTLVYTYFGGLRAVVWVDVVQMFVFLFGAAAALFVLLRTVPGGWSGFVAAAAPAHKLRVIHWTGGFASAQWVLTGVVGGAFLSMASHGVDHLIVQRLLAARSLGDARKALVASGLAVFGLFATFLVIGVGLFAHFHGAAFAKPDEAFPTFIVRDLPAGLGGLVIAAIFSIAMSSEASALNSLASVLTHDLYAPLAGRAGDDEHLMRVGKRFTLLSGAILVGGAMLFQLALSGTPMVVIALQVASFTYGGLLGGFLLGLLSKDCDGTDAVAGMAVAIALMALLWAAQQFGAVRPRVDTLWFTLLGSALTLAAGHASRSLRRRRAAAR